MTTQSIESLIAKETKRLWRVALLLVSILYLGFLVLIWSEGKNAAESQIHAWLSVNKKALQEFLYVENSNAIRGILGSRLQQQTGNFKIQDVSVYDQSGLKLLGDGNQQIDLQSIQIANNRVDKLGFRIQFVDVLRFADNIQGYVALTAIFDYGFVIRYSVAMSILCGFILGLLVLLKNQFMSEIGTQLIRPIIDLSRTVGLGQLDEIQTRLKDNSRVPVAEINELHGSFRKLLSRISDLSQKKEDEVRLITAGEIARQVAHDIRSPLSALEIVMETSSELPEKKRTLVRSAVVRIREIANNLLTKHVDNITLAHGNQITATSAGGAIELIADEKHVQLQTRNIKLNHNISIQEFGYFINVNPIEFRRVISNLLNNSIEAVQGPFGKIDIRILESEKNVTVEIQDNGQGIPHHILEQLGKKEVSFGKAGLESGTGIGVLHAQRFMDQSMGQLKIQSEVGQGTRLELVFPRCQPPAWFISNIPLKQSEVVIVDDDLTVHDRWKARLAERNIVHHTDPASFLRWLPSVSIEEYWVLMDFEFHGSSVTGIDCLSKIQDRSKCILVTNNWFDQDVQRKVLELKIKLVPKIFVESIPVS